MEKYKLKPIINLKELFDSNYLVDCTIDCNDVIFLLAQRKKNADSERNYSRENLINIYDVYKVEKNDIIHKFSVENISIDLSFIRVIDEKFLLASSRCRYFDEKNIEKNVLIMNKSGIVIDELIFGDGIQDIKVEKSGIIWTSYFDEGIFGNYGWLDPLGMNGLRSWSVKGESLYEYGASSYDYSISDCYALNIDAQNNKWFYFYTEFYLAKLSEAELKYYSLDVSGANTIALNEEFLLSDSGYGSTNYVIHKKDEDKFIKTLEFDLVDFNSDKSIKITKSVAYEDKILLLDEDRAFMFKIDDVTTKFNIR